MSRREYIESDESGSSDSQEGISEEPFRLSLLRSRNDSSKTFRPLYQTEPDYIYYDLCAKDEAEPPVIYYADIYNSSTAGGRTRNYRQEAVRYRADRPFQFATGVQNQTTQGDIAQPKESGVEYDNEILEADQEEEAIAKWTGTVLQINLSGKAQFPYTTTSDEKERPDAPKKTEDLALEKIWMVNIVLQSPHLLQALERLVDYYPSFYTKIQAGYKNGIVIYQPFAVVLHHFHSIKGLVEKEYADPSHEKESRELRKNKLQKDHMRYLYDFAEPLYHKIAVPCEQYLSEACPRIAFDMIWYLLKPGIDVYVQYEGLTFVGVVMDVTKRSDATSYEQQHWAIDIWHLRTGGAKIRQTRKACKVSTYSGLRDVTDLPIYPVSIWDAKDQGERRKKILARSKVFFKALQQGSLLAYHDGPVRDSNSYVCSYLRHSGWTLTII